MSRKNRLPLAAAVLLLDAVQWVVSEAVAAAAWTSPPYSYATNYISDLGVPECGTHYQGRTICSPDHALMNTSFIAQGVLFATGAILLALALLTGRARRVVIALAAAHAVGFILVGLFHGSPDGPGYSLALHVGGAAVAILCANTVVILAGSLRSLQLPYAYRVFSITVGALGLLSEAFVGASTSTAGIFERGGVYSWLLWSAVTGVCVLVRHLRRPVGARMPENVPA
ncbi:DUF998 domain-containing protein [Streptomyces sp. MBT62]|uniref:DUF998 domain-containing protein n=1 Tax=Streptomyces sp. MBT62 TaxID=2800410 RepID=UPI00190C430C|nr:DUF998 domain-containing protein [Streptomyces sp. MBT62]MBK3567716.1 DUF998 domain-containing protein [Streptomyces sp. MBT62]